MMIILSKQKIVCRWGSLENSWFQTKYYSDRNKDMVVCTDYPSILRCERESLVGRQCVECEQCSLR